MYNTETMLRAAETNLEKALDERRLKLMGFLQEFVSHEVMNSLTRAILNLDSGEIEKTKLAIYQSATSLQDLQLLGQDPGRRAGGKVPLNDLAKKATGLCAGLFREHQIHLYQDLKQTADIFLRPQSQLISMIEILLTSAKCLEHSLQRSILVSTVISPSFARLSFVGTGTALSSRALDFQESPGLGLAKKVVEADSGSLWIERDPMNFKISIQFPRNQNGQ